MRRADRGAIPPLAVPTGTVPPSYRVLRPGTPTDIFGTASSRCPRASPARPSRRPSGSRRRVADQTRRRNLRSVQQCSAAVVAMTIVMIMPVMVRRAGRTAHGDPAGRAELPVLRFHAGRNPRHVRDDIGTKPHRIGRARLTGGIAALGGRAVREKSKRTGQQCKRASQLDNTHLITQL
jgi:hypothetical protein